MSDVDPLGNRPEDYASSSVTSAMLRNPSRADGTEFVDTRTATGGCIVHSCNWRMFGEEGDPDQLFVVWSCEVPFTVDRDARPGPDDTDGMGSKGADPELWERIPLSQFYAAKEADDARKAAVSV